MTYSPTSEYLQKASEKRHQATWCGAKGEAIRHSRYKALEPQLLRLLAQEPLNLRGMWDALPAVGKQTIKGSCDILLKKGWIEQVGITHRRNSSPKHQLTELGKNQLRGQS